MRIFVTGIGIASPLAVGTEATWSALLAGRRAMAPLTLFELPGCRSDLAAEVALPDDSDPGKSRADRMALLAAREAVAQAGIVADRDIELLVGGTTAGLYENELLLAAVTADPERAVLDERMRSHPLSAPADRIHEELGPFRQTRSLCSACSGGATAIVLAAEAILGGRTERALAGGVDALCRLSYAGFAALGALDPEPCRPFDARRAGLNLGEGAAFLVLESEASAERRGAQPIAELCGWAMASEAHHVTHPEPDGRTAAWTMSRALARAGLDAERVGYINAHGTATPHNDSMEARAIERALGSDAPRVPVSATKGHIGHTLGAAGAIEAGIAALAVARGVIPPTVGLEHVDPACARLDHVREARQLDVAVALSNSFGFGGNDTTLALARPGTGRAHQAPSARRVVVTGGAGVGPRGVHGLAGSACYAEPGPPPTDGVDMQALRLDPMRARRLARGTRIATSAIDRALDDALLDDGHGAETGVVVGSAFGTPSGTGGFLIRIFEKGARFASPAVFPFVLPSALASTPSIYHRFHGPAFSIADLATSAECAVILAADLIRSGEARAMVAAAVEEKSPVAERIAGPMLSGLPDRGLRSEGAAALVLEDAAAAARRGAPIRAELLWSTSWRGENGLWHATLPAPSGRAAVYRAREPGPAAPAGWSELPCHALADRCGDHEAAGGFAVLLALSALNAGSLDVALVLGEAPDRGYALLFGRANTRDHVHE